MQWVEYKEKTLNNRWHVFKTFLVLSKQAESWQGNPEDNSKQNIQQAGGDNRGCHDLKPPFLFEDKHYTGNKGRSSHDVSCDGKQSGIGVADQNAQKQPY